MTDKILKELKEEYKTKKEFKDAIKNAEETIDLSKIAIDKENKQWKTVLTLYKCKLKGMKAIDPKWEYEADEDYLNALKETIQYKMTEDEMMHKGTLNRYETAAKTANETIKHCKKILKDWK